MQPLYLVGGEQKDDLTGRDEWHRHRVGVIIRLDPETRTASRVLEYQSPAEFCPDDDPSFLLKAATLHEDTMFACSATEVLVYDFPSMQLRQRISHPCFNDLHHVTSGLGGKLYVASTGLDQVVEMTADGDITRQWCVLEDKDVWHRHSPEVDYRKVPTTKPHDAHPNYVFFLDGEVWATRCKQRDAVCLTAPGQRIETGSDNPIHDGVVTEDSIWFTQVDAHVVRVDRDSLQVTERHDLSKMMSGLRRPGWCRGLHIVDDEHVLVGFSRLRPTKWKTNVGWLKLNELRWLYRLPARIGLFNLKEQRAVWEIELQDFGLTTVFSIHPEPKPEAVTEAA